MRPRRNALVALTAASGIGRPRFLLLTRAHEALVSFLRLIGTTYDPNRLQRYYFFLTYERDT